MVLMPPESLVSSTCILLKAKFYYVVFTGAANAL